MKNKVVRLTLLLLVFFFLGYYIFLHVTHHDRHSVDKILIVDCQKTAKTHTITITKDSFNPQIVMHNFVIDAFNVKSNTIGSGETTTVSFTPDKTGTFEFYCSIGSHKQMGMKGNLIVE